MSDELAMREQALRAELALILKPARATEIEAELAQIAEARREMEVEHLRAEYDAAKAELEKARAAWGGALARKDELMRRRRELLELGMANRASPEFPKWQNEFWQIETSLAQLEWASWDRNTHPFAHAGVRGNLNRAVGEVKRARDAGLALGVDFGVS